MPMALRVPHKFLLQAAVSWYWGEDGFFMLSLCKFLKQAGHTVGVLPTKNMLCISRMERRGRGQQGWWRGAE